MLFLERDPLVSTTEWSRDVVPDRDRPCAPLPHAPRRFTLLCWTVILALMHFDRGAAAVAAMDIGRGHTVLLSFSYAVALLAWHSVGLAAGCVFAGAAFQQVPAKVVLVMSMLTNAAALTGLGLQAEMHFVLMSLLRTISGFAASLPLAFLPLWVDEYAPSESKAQWMALVQMGAPLGQFSGAVVAGVVTAATRERRHLDWRFALLVQAGLLVPVILRVLFMRHEVEVANITSSRARIDSLSVHTSDAGMVREIQQAMSRNPLNLTASSTLVFLHATAAGLSLWAAPYLALSAGAPPALWALLISMTALIVMPMFGTYIGALLCDRLEGFKAGHHASALRVACAFLVVAAIPALINGEVAGFGPRVSILALWLFGAGAFLPICAGVVMTSMPSYLRSFSAALSTLVIHLLSFAVLPIVCGGLMSCFSRAEEGLAFGVALSLWMTVPAAALLLLAYVREPKAMVSCYAEALQAAIVLKLRA